MLKCKNLTFLSKIVKNTNERKNPLRNTILARVQVTFNLVMKHVEGYANNKSRLLPKQSTAITKKERRRRSEPG